MNLGLFGMLVGHWVSSSVNASSCPMPIFFLIISELEIIPSLAFYVPLFRFFYLNDCWFFKYCKYLFLVTCVLKIPVISYPEKILFSLIWTSVQFSCSVVSDSLRPHESQHARPPCPSPTPGVHSDSHPSSQWCHPAISSSVIPFSSCPNSCLPASKSFPMSQLFTWGGQSTGASASASFLPKKSQGWSPSEWTSWISLQSKRLSRVFSNTTVQKHQFFSTQPSSQSNSHIHTWLLEKP